MRSVAAQNKQITLIIWEREYKVQVLETCTYTVIANNILNIQNNNYIGSQLPVYIFKFKDLLIELKIEKVSEQYSSEILFSLNVKVCINLLNFKLKINLKNSRIVQLFVSCSLLKLELEISVKSPFF